MIKRKSKKTTRKPLVRKKSVPDVPKTKIEKLKRVKLRVIGIGGGGSSIVSEIATRIKKASFVVANTDIQALKSVSKKAHRFQFGESVTKGLGTGMNADLGRKAAQTEKERIKKILMGQDLCILVVSLGGGAGSGASPVFAKISKDLGNITYGIFTLPFRFEGEKKMEIAKRALKRLKPKLDLFSVIPNEKIFQIIDKKTPLKKALSTINKNLTKSLEGLIEVIYEPGLINIDFADFRTILLSSNPLSEKSTGRLAYLNTVEVSRKGKAIEDLLEKALNNPLYPYTISGAKGVLLNIAGEKNLSLAEVSQISKTISKLVDKEAKIIFGISQSKKYSGTIKTTLLATGCTTRLFSRSKPPLSKKKKKRLKKKIKTSLSKASKRKLRKVKRRSKSRKRASVSKSSPKVSSPIRKKSKKSLSKKTKRSKSKKSKPKRIKIKVSRKRISRRRRISVSPEEQTKKTLASVSSPEVKIRKNALQIKKEAEAEEKEILAREKFWETPAFLRKKLVKDK